MRGNLLAEFDYPGSITATSHAFSSDGKIIIGYNDGSLRLYNSVMPLEDFLKSDKIEPLTGEQKKSMVLNNYLFMHRILLFFLCSA